MQRRSQTIPRGVGQIHPIFTDRVENCRTWDAEGYEYLDFMGRITVLNTERLHPEVVAAVGAQLKKLLHTCFQVPAYEPYLELCETADQKIPDDFAKKTLLVTAGLEAMENTMKIARVATKRSGTITSSGAYHGRTHYTLALAGKVNPYSTGMGLVLGHVYRVPYPCPLHGISEGDAIASIHRIFKNGVAPEDIAAIAIEPVRGEGGFYATTPAFMQRSCALCGEHGIVLTADEVQSGVGRTGALFVMKQMGVAPDLITSAKPIAGDFPLAGIAGRAEVMDAAAPGGLGSTHVGNLITCVAAPEVLEVFEQEDSLQKADDLGQKLKDGLLAMAERHTEIGDIHGLGAVIAIELSEGGDHGKPDTKLTTEIMARVRDKGLALLSYGPYNNVPCTLVPLTTEDAQIRQGLEIISQCFAEAEQQICTRAGGGAARPVRPARVQIG